MALSFSFPTGKVKKQQQLTQTTAGEIKKSQIPGPKSWKSFPSLSFFKNSETTSIPVTTTEENVKVLPNTNNTSCKLPVRTIFYSTKDIESSTRKSLPDVTDTTTTNTNTEPTIVEASGKPCDLLAQLQLQQLQEKIRKDGKEMEEIQTNQKEDLIVSDGGIFDDNGNPWDHRQDREIVDLDKGQGSLESLPVEEEITSKIKIPGTVDIQETEDIPKYFINAAELSEEDTFIMTEPLSPPQNDHVQTKDPESMNSKVSTEELDALVPVPAERKPAVNNESDGPTSNMVPVPAERKCQKPVPAERKHSINETSPDPPGTSHNPSSVVIRPRVPVSKSYPDIIQTTFNSDEKDTALMNRELKKDNSDLESLVADSLENLAPTPKEDQQQEQDEPPFKAFESQKPQEVPISTPTMIPTPQQHGQVIKNPGIGILSSSAMMTESQMGGLFAEKPPEAWVIDLNSLSLDSTAELEASSSRRSTSGGNTGSNNSSMAFFVNMDSIESAGVGGARGDRRNSGSSMSSSIGGPDKKIFSMFVDIRGEGNKESHIPTTTAKKSVINKPVMNLMENSTGSLQKSSRRFPSPIFQHKAAAEAARQAAKQQWEKQREKYFDSLEPSSLFMGLPYNSNTNTHTNTIIDEKEPNIGSGMGESTISNRSSLHVANVLESSFSSSFISSMETSQPEDMEICQGGPCFKLGKDLLRMFQEGINTDVNISANGKWIKAHKCILASRSQYFAAILSGHWVEKAGNTINLDGFSYNIVQFALYHIYSGTNEIPDTLDLLELASLTDLLGLEGLRENISQTFRVKFCHNFHRPCTGCITGVLECFPIATTYGMDELHRKMIKWICKHFVRIWPTKGFASLGDELIDKCLRYSINHLSVDNILDHTLGCDQLSTTMPSLRWTEAIFSIVTQLSEECVHFLGDHLSDVLQSQKFLQFGKGQAWNISRIEATFMESMTLLKPDVACLSHTALTRLIELGTETIDEVEWSTSFVDFLRMLREEIERYLLANASKAVLSKCWEELGPSIRNKICSSSFIGYDKFGNKIVKNTGASSSTTNKKQPLKARSGIRNTLPSSPAVNLRSSSSKSKPSSDPQPHPQPQQGSTSTSKNTPLNAKIASVRPMQSHQNQRERAEIQDFSSLQSKTLANLGRTLSSAKSSDSSSIDTVTTTNTIARPTSAKNKSKTNPIATMDRDKSFSRRTSSLSTASPTASANRTPMKPLTPSVHSKPSPLTGHDIQQIQPPKSKGVRSTNRSTHTQSPKPIEPPKKTFLTNSAKAAAVSKPLLKSTAVNKKTPTSSISSLNSQGSTVTSQNQNTRFLSTHKDSTVASGGTFSARSSFSNLERPHSVKSKVDSNPPSSRRNTCGASSGQQIRKQNTIPVPSTRSKPRPTSSSAALMPSRNTNARKSTLHNQSGHSSMPPMNPHHPQQHDSIVDDSSLNTMDSLNDSHYSYSKDSLIMSRSTIETESGEVKLRTLAEIGRSSTFSKDEPTILGKMDGSTYSHIDYDEYE